MKVEKIVECPKCGGRVKTSGIPGEKVRVICPVCKIEGWFLVPGEKPLLFGSFMRQHLPYLIVAVFILLFFVFIFPFWFFFILIPVFVFLCLDGRIPLGFALLMLTLCFYEDEAFANQLAIVAYWLLVVGTVCLLVEYFRDRKKSGEEQRSV
jgi:hypothetical protein